jgi:hypothetical protein
MTLSLLIILNINFLLSFNKTVRQQQTVRAVVSVKATDDGAADEALQIDSGQLNLNVFSLFPKELTTSLLPFS